MSVVVWCSQGNWVWRFLVYLIIMETISGWIHKSKMISSILKEKMPLCISKKINSLNNKYILSTQ